MRFIPVAIALSTSLLLAGTAFAGPVATVNGVTITDEDLALAQEDIGAQVPGNDEAAKRQAVIDYLIDLKIVAQEADKEKLGDGPDFARRLAMARDKVLMDRLLSDAADKATSDAAVKAFYDQSIKTLKPEEEVHARHILVPTEEEAKQALDKLKNGEDFAKLAGELSKDPGSGKEGGDLGYFTKDRMVKEFGDAAFALKPGETSGIVKTQFGYHIIKVEDRRTKPIPTLDTVKEQLKTYLGRKAQQEKVTALRAAAKVERFGPDGKPLPAEKPAEAPVPAEPKKN
jgi:peptidyl-prolyl cis-trans isomerase C